MEKIEKPDRVGAVAMEMGDNIAAQFAPVETPEEATHKWTTGELSDAVCKHTGTRIPADDLFDLLKDMGFRYLLDDSYISARYVWLLKKR